MRITNKEQMYEMLHAGRFGNIVQQWNSFEEMRQSGYRGLVSLRVKEVSNPVRLYHVRCDDVERALMERFGTLNPDCGLVLSAAPPDEKRTLQGELAWNVGGVSPVLRWTTVQRPMRLAFDEFEATCAYARARWLLQQYLWPVDYDNLIALAEKYDDHVIEFSGFSCPVGVIPGRRMVIWEVRAY